MYNFHTTQTCSIRSMSAQVRFNNAYSPTLPILNLTKY